MPDDDAACTLKRSRALPEERVVACAEIGGQASRMPATVVET